ncbi:uncharacterized protein LOC116934680 [Daphnia magna]|nr:uncharacterized protein LOC116934680 [Daphnia magna]
MTSITRDSSCNLLENMEETHIDLALEKISPFCSLNLPPDEEQQSMLYDSEMFCDDDFRSVETCSTTPESEASLLVQEDTFEVCITKMSGTHLMEIFCEEHREEMICYLAMEYAKIRHHFEQKRLNNLLLSKSKAKVKSKSKEAKNA